MDLHDLRVYFNNLVQKSKSIQRDKLYYIDVNKKLRSVIKKLESMNVVKIVYANKNRLALKLENYDDFHPFRTQVFVNRLNHPRVFNQVLGQDPYVFTIVSTDRGIRTEKQCVDENVGGVILARIRVKTPV